MEITPQEVIQNSDILYKSETNWITDIKWTPPDEQEIILLKGTIPPPCLLEREASEAVPEETELTRLKNIKTKIKVIALDKMNESPLCNTSYMSQSRKQELIKHMEEALELYNTDKIMFDDVFNKICNKSIFTGDYSSMPIYGC